MFQHLDLDADDSCLYKSCMIWSMTRVKNASSHFLMLVMLTMIFLCPHMNGVAVLKKLTDRVLRSGEG